MNYKILEKCVEALTKENPDISYIRGMLETLLAMEDKGIGIIMTPSSSITQPSGYVGTPVGGTNVGTVADEAAILDMKARSALATVQELTKTE